MTVKVERVPNGVRLTARDRKYERWFEVPVDEVPLLIVQLGKTIDNNVDVWPVYDN